MFTKFIICAYFIFSSGIGVDDMFILLSGIADADYNGNTESRVGQMLKRSGVAITITSLTDILAFGVGATSSFKSVRNFCVYTGKLFVHVCFRSFNSKLHVKTIMVSMQR